jgi:hypothetical protein
MECGVSARLTVYTKSGVKLMGNFVHRIKAKRHCTHMKLLHFHLCPNRPFREGKERQNQEWGSPFWVNVPVLSLRRYSIRPSSSGKVLVRTIVPGISLSFMIKWA